MNSRHCLLLLTLSGALPAGLASQQLTLAEALARAEATGYANRAARAQASAEEARRAREEAERLLAAERKRVKELEKELSQINTTLK